MPKPHRAFSPLAKFTSTPFEKAETTHKLSRVSQNFTVEDLFGDEPEHAFVHKGAVKHAGDLRIRVAGDYAGVYVIDGDLTIGGTFSLGQSDGASIVYVTGSVRAKNLSLSESAQLWVGKNLQVSNVVLDDLSDAGGLVVHGMTTAKTIIERGRGNGRELKKKPAAKLVLATKLPDSYSDLPASKLLPLIEKGVDLTVAPKVSKGTDITKKKPDPALLALTTFNAISFKDAVKHYKLAELRGTPDWNKVVSSSDKPKPAYVHAGDVTVRGTINVMSTDRSRVGELYVIDGDLTVDGSLSLDTDYVHRTIGLVVVTGNVHATRVAIGNASLWVAGDLSVDECIVCDHKVHVKGLLRGGAIVITGLMPTTSAAPEAKIINEYSDVSYFDPVPSFEKKLKSIPYGRGLKASFAKKTHNEIRKAVAAGKSVVK